MKAKKISVILVTIAFIAVVILSSIGLFALKKVNVTYAVSEKSDNSAIQTKLEKLIGSNLIFFDEQEVYDLLSDEYYMEVLSVEKQLPNVLNVSIKERREVYYFMHEQKLYIMTENGFLLNALDDNQADAVLSGNLREKITLKTQGVNILSAELGKTLNTDKDNLMATLFSMATLMDLTDCIKSITLTCATEVADVLFETYTGVSIRIEKIYEYSTKKTELALEVYDRLITDYQKSYGEIQVFKMDDGRLRATHNQELITTRQL